MQKSWLTYSASQIGLTESSRIGIIKNSHRSVMLRDFRKIVDTIWRTKSRSPNVTEHFLKLRPQKSDLRDIQRAQANRRML